MCIQCSRDQSNKQRIKRRTAAGKGPRKVFTPEEAAERIRCRDRIRSVKRRQDPSYNAAQIERKRKWCLNNREQHLASSRAYSAKQLKENLQRRLSKNLRHRIYKAMLGRTKGVSAVRHLGISIEDFKIHIENQFSVGMSWSNYGKWHLDHIRPLKSFDLTDQVQALAACHYTNYQPLWAEDNTRKHDNYGDVPDGLQISNQQCTL